MKYKFMNPDQILNVMIALIILAVGIFAFFVTVTSVPVQAPVSNTLPGVLSGSHAIDNCNTTEYIPVTTPYNLTTPCILKALNTTTGNWDTIHAAGACNGTFISANDTYRVNPGTVRLNGTWDVMWSHFNLSYTQSRGPSSQLANSSYYAIINVSTTGNSVFNIIGVILIIGAIMTIVGLVYSYVRPGRY